MTCRGCCAAFPGYKCVRKPLEVWRCDFTELCQLPTPGVHRHLPHIKTMHGAVVFLCTGETKAYHLGSSAGEKMCLDAKTQLRGCKTPGRGFTTLNVEANTKTKRPLCKVIQQEFALLSVWLVNAGKQLNQFQLFCSLKVCEWKSVRVAAIG